MVRYELQPPPVVITAFTVVEVKNIFKNALFNKDTMCYREVVLENNEEVLVLESNDKPTKVGDLVRYEVLRDDYILFDPKVAEANGLTLVSIN